MLWSLFASEIDTFFSTLNLSASNEHDHFKTEQNFCRKGDRERLNQMQTNANAPNTVFCAIGTIILDIKTKKGRNILSRKCFNIKGCNIGVFSLYEENNQQYNQMHCFTAGRGSIIAYIGRNIAFQKCVGLSDLNGFSRSVSC